MLNRDFKEIISAFNAARVDYLVVGAYALAAHGLPRATGDIDLWVRPVPENAKRIVRALAAFGAQAYVELRDDPTWTAKPANFNTLKFVWTSTLSGDDYSSIGASAIAALVTQNDFVQPAWDPTSPAFERWFAVYQSFNPGALPPGSGFIPGAYDAAMVMALAVTAAGTTEGTAVAAQIRRVANPPGRVVCPGQWRKAFRLLAKGRDINYEGALGPVDLDERGNATGLAFGIFRVQPGGTTSAQVSNFGFAAHPVCDEDDEDEGHDDDDDDRGDDDGDRDG